MWYMLCVSVVLEDVLLLGRGGRMWYMLCVSVVLEEVIG